MVTNLKSSIPEIQRCKRIRNQSSNGLEIMKIPVRALARILKPSVHSIGLWTDTFQPIRAVFLHADRRPLKPSGRSSIHANHRRNQVAAGSSACRRLPPPHRRPAALFRPSWPSSAAFHHLESPRRRPELHARRPRLRRRTPTKPPSHRSCPFPPPHGHCHLLRTPSSSIVGAPSSTGKAAIHLHPQLMTVMAADRTSPPPLFFSVVGQIRPNRRPSARLTSTPSRPPPFPSSPAPPSSLLLLLLLSRAPHDHCPTAPLRLHSHVIHASVRHTSLSPFFLHARESLHPSIASAPPPL